MALFDANLHPEGLTDQDLESLAFFNVRAALVVASAPAEPSARTLRLHFDDLVGRQLERLKRVGIRGYVALGVHPRAVPRRGLEEVLSALPDYFRGGQVIAVGEIGIAEQVPEQEEAFLEQVALAKRLKLKVLVHTPAREKEKRTRRTLSLLRESGIAAERVLVDHATARTVKLITAVGHYAGLTLHPEALRVEQAVALVRKLGSERLVLDTDAGHGATDLLGLPRAAHLLEKGKLDERIIARVCNDNAARFLDVAAA